jgi:hypothetical protein
MGSTRIYGGCEMKRRAFLEVGLAGISAMVIAEKARALEYYPNPSDKKWAILYATWCGAARDAGVWISEGMGGIADVFDVRENPDLRKFDHLVIGSAIRSAKVAPELEAYLVKNRSWISEKVRGLYTVCGNMQRPVTPEVTKQQITDHLAPLCGVKEAIGHVFLGRVTPSLLAPDVRGMMSGMGEYDNLKRPECMAFGKEILSRP